ncbi:MAG TPA: sigma-70 family RNA polymerase sigma factor [Jatrophihabitans sp.]|nr:sigma-70 family RNA polymerase sigma factor [Jatrophihabitans sp.]
MAAPAQPWLPAPRAAAGLRRLLDLVNDARPNCPLVVAQSADADARPRPGPAPGGTVAAVRHPSPHPTGSRPDDTHPVPLDAGHAESWRLVRRAQQGDGDAFGQLYDRYVDVVFRFVYFRVNDRTLAEDFTSETFLRALRRITTISYQGRDIGAWFVTIARNIVLDHLKSARHRLETPTADTIERDDPAPSTEAAVLASLQSQRLMQAVAKLGDEQRECIVLRFVQGMSVSETAAIMGKNDGAIKALQHRAVRKLADLLGTDPR